MEPEFLLRLGGRQRRLSHRRRIFPLEVRARAIAVFYAFGTALGGIAGPVLFGALIQTGARINICLGLSAGRGSDAGGRAVEARIGIAAERKSLEDVAAPLSKI